jgi:hypothetical protein
VTIPAELYHYTCDHAAARIGGLLIPAVEQVTFAHPYLTPLSEFVWLTDLGAPDRDALGLTSNYLLCDRTRHRYRVTEGGHAIWWMDLRRVLAWEWVEAVESAPGARPVHWWAAHDPVPVELAEIPAALGVPHN